VNIDMFQNHHTFHLLLCLSMVRHAALVKSAPGEKVYTSTVFR